MDSALTELADITSAVIICHRRWCRAKVRWAVFPCQLRSFLLLQGKSDPLRFQLSHNIIRCRRKKCEYGKCTIFLILLEPPPKANHTRSATVRAEGLLPQGKTHFSFAMRSLLMRSRASDSFPNTYCAATYPAPKTPTPIAIGVRFRRNQRRVAVIMAQIWEPPVRPFYMRNLGITDKTLPQYIMSNMAAEV